MQLLRQMMVLHIYTMLSAYEMTAMQTDRSEKEPRFCFAFAAAFSLVRH